MASHWADLPIIRDTESGIAAIEREQMTKPRPLDIEEPPLHQPCSQHVVTMNEYVFLAALEITFLALTVNTKFNAKTVHA
jgi:hypothetical protein